MECIPPNALFKVMTVEITDNESLAANTSVSKSVALPTVTGYTAVGVIGINIVTSTSNGANWGQYALEG